jgi:hypothetical protein
MRGKVLMPTEHCFAGICFIPLETSSPKFFGFSELLAGLALMVLAWTIADVRYRFRVRAAPLPLQNITFLVVAAIGILTLLTDLWRAEGWLVPEGNVLTPAIWQAALAALFLLTFLTWTWFAFIRPPRFGKRNAKRYAQALYRFILKGDPTELASIADELMRSARPLVGYATNRDARGTYRSGKIDGTGHRVPPDVEAYANDLLLLIADKRLCRVIVASSPGTALAIFREMAETKRYGIQVGTFARNIVNEAIVNKDSFLYHEAEGYESGLLGYHKPLSQAMFSNYEMVETIGTLLDPDIKVKSKWDATQWSAYCRAVLIVFRDYTEKSLGSHSYTLARAMGYIEWALMDLYKLDGMPSVPWDDDLLSRLREVVRFVQATVGTLDNKVIPDRVTLRLREQESVLNSRSIYDDVAKIIFEVIFAASAVKSPRDHCWWIQHNSVWGELFNFNHLLGPAGRVVKFKVRRLLYDSIAEMNRFPNFKGAKILGFCLNVMGLELSDGRYDKDSRALHKAVLAWTKRHYAWLNNYNPRVADACLVDGTTYDAEHHRIVRTYPVEGLRRKAQYTYLDVAPPPSPPDPDQE